MSEPMSEPFPAPEPDLPASALSAPVTPAPAPASSRPAAPESAPRQAVRAVPWLAIVCAAFVVVQLLFVVPGSGLGWDETVYTSQVSGHIPAAFFSAPRARGISFLAAPVAEFTTSTLALRVYMAALSGLGLFVSLRVWRGLLPVRVLALAGGLFAGLWITLFYGPQVMPNLWSAYGALAAVGCFLRGARDRTDRTALIGLAAGVTVVGLMRPPDAAWLVLPLAIAALTVRHWRRPVLFAALAAGLLLGCAEWVIEAYVRYGGLSARMHRASGIEGGMGLHMAVDDQVRSLNGRALCRPCDVPWRHRVTSAWWFALPVLVAIGAVVAPRARRTASWLAVLAAASLALPYLFTISYAAPRFLLPAYALLAIPVAECLWWLVTRADGRLRPAATALVAAALCGHLAVQGSVLAKATGNNHKARQQYDAVAARLHAYGVRPPCLVSGASAVPIAFYAGCVSRQTSGPDESITAAGVRAAARHQPAAVIVAVGGRPPAYARTWRSVPLSPASAAGGFRAYLPPAPGPA
jgi:hypothetical protein